MGWLSTQDFIHKAPRSDLPSTLDGKKREFTNSVHTGWTACKLCSIESYYTIVWIVIDSLWIKTEDFAKAKGQRQQILFFSSPDSGELNNRIRCLISSFGISGNQIIKDLLKKGCFSLKINLISADPKGFHLTDSQSEFDEFLLFLLFMEQQYGPKS